MTSSVDIVGAIILQEEADKLNLRANLIYGKFEMIIAPFFGVIGWELQLVVDGWMIEEWMKCE